MNITERIVDDIWSLETTSNDLDTDFARSSITLSRFLCPNLGDPPQKKIVFPSKFRRSPKRKKRSSASLKPSSSGQNHIRSLTNFHRQTQWGEPGLFSFSVQKSVSKVLKTGYFAYFSGQWGGYCPPRTPLVMLLLLAMFIYPNLNTFFSYFFFFFVFLYIISTFKPLNA